MSKKRKPRIHITVDEKIRDGVALIAEAKGISESAAWEEIGRAQLRTLGFDPDLTPKQLMEALRKRRDG